MKSLVNAELSQTLGAVNSSFFCLLTAKVVTSPPLTAQPTFHLGNHDHHLVWVSSTYSRLTLGHLLSIHHDAAKFHHSGNNLHHILPTICSFEVFTHNRRAFHLLMVVEKARLLHERLKEAIHHSHSQIGLSWCGPVSLVFLQSPYILAVMRSTDWPLTTKQSTLSWSSLNKDHSSCWPILETPNRHQLMRNCPTCWLPSIFTECLTGFYSPEVDCIQVCVSCQGENHKHLKE